MADNLIELVKQMDRCWLERRFSDLASFIAQDVVVVAPDGTHRVQGLDSAVESYREFMNRCTVNRFSTSDYVVAQRGEAAVIEYAWNMAWNDRGTNHEAVGREVLVLSRRDSAWRVIWRMQISASA
jgi:ketosteroid isomerase-like protein